MITSVRIPAIKETARVFELVVLEIEWGDTRVAGKVGQLFQLIAQVGDATGKGRRLPGIIGPRRRFLAGRRAEEEHPAAARATVFSPHSRRSGLSAARDLDSGNS